MAKVEVRNQAGTLILGNFAVNFVLRLLNFSWTNGLSSYLLGKYLHKTILTQIQFLH